jgi:hypothetical protein
MQNDQRLQKLPPPHALEKAAKELSRVAKWMEEKSVLLTSQIEKELKEETTSGSDIALIASCPESKPFWVDSNQSLECIACKFSQKHLKSWEQPEKLPWMTKRINRNGTALFIALCPSCTTGEPWIIHCEGSYTMINMKQKNGSDPLITSETRPKNTDGWPARPVEAPVYHSSWTLGDFFDKPNVLKEQEKRFDDQVNTFELEKMNYESFCEEKIAQIPPIRHLSTHQVIQKIEKRKLDTRQAKFAEHDFSRKYTLPIHMRPKLHKHNEGAPFNSPTPAHNKENLSATPNSYSSP